MDLHCVEDFDLEPGSTMLINTGLAVAIPEGYEMQIRPRSGLALNYSVTVLNTPGTVDSDYRGAIRIILINHGSHVLPFKTGDRIAQAVICPVVQAELEETEDELPITLRGNGGFGSTGKA